MVVWSVVLVTAKSRVFNVEKSILCSLSLSCGITTGSILTLSFIPDVFGLLPDPDLTFFFGRPPLLEDRLSIDEALDEILDVQQIVELSLCESIDSIEESRIFFCFLGTHVSEEMLKGVSGSTKLSIPALISISCVLKVNLPEHEGFPGLCIFPEDVSISKS